MMVYEANAGSTSRLLGLGTSLVTKKTSISEELSRRRLWAYYILNQFVDRTASRKFDLSDFAAVPLPCDEDNFENDTIPDQFFMLDGGERNSSYYAELIRIGSLW